MEVARRTSRTSPTPMDPELARTEGEGRARPSETFLPGFEGRDIEASGARIHLARGGAGRRLVRLHGHVQAPLSTSGFTPPVYCPSMS